MYKRQNLYGQRVALAVGRRQTAEEERSREAAAEHKYERMFAAVRDAVFLHRADGPILDANEGAVGMFGMPRQKLIGRSIEKLLPPASRTWLARLQRVILSSGEFHGEGIGLRHDHTEFPMELSSSLVELDGEKLVITVARDISERRRAEAAVRSSEHLHRTTLAAMSDPAHVVDRDYRIVLVNEAYRSWCRGLGAGEKVAGGNLFETHPFLGDRVREEYERVFATGRPLRTEETTILRGRRIETETQKLPVVEDGVVSRVLTVMRDVTDRKRHEEILRRLADTATGFVELPVGADLYLYAAERLAELLPGAVFAVCEYDEEKATLTVRRLVGLTEAELAAVVAALGASPEGMVLEDVPPDVHEVLMNGSPREVAGGLHEAMLGRVPEPACRELERGLGIEKAVSIGLRRESRLYGNATFYLRKGQRLDPGLVETFIGQWAIALERQEAELALAESEERYSSLFAGAPVGIYRTTPAGRVLMANPALVRMLGYESFEEMARLDLEQAAFQPGYDRAEFKRRMENDGEVVGLESTWTRADGGKLYIRENARAVRGPDGSIQYYEGTVEDLTERHRAEERERAERERAETYLDIAGVIIVALDEQGRVALVNRRGCEVLGTTEDDALGSDWVERFVPAADRKKTRATFAALMRGEVEPAEEFENLVLSASGEERLVHWHNVLLRDPEGNITGMLSSGEDVTERRAAENALRELRDNAPVGLFRTTADGRFLSANPAAVRIAGYENEKEMLNAPVVSMYADPAQRDEMRALLAREGSVTNYEIRSRRPDGSIFFALFDIRMVPGPDGKPCYFDGAVRDITAQKAAEQARRESEEQLEAMLETSPDGIAVHQEGRVVMMNPAGVRMLGYDDPAEVVGKSVPDFLHPDEKDEVLARMRRIIETGPTGTAATARFRRRDGSYVPLEVANARLDWKGRPAIQVVFRDITARLESQWALAESEQRYRNVVERALDGIVIIKEGRIVYLNPQLAAMAGLTVEECLGRPFADFLHPDEREKVAERYRCRMSGEAVPENYETVLLHRDGRPVRVELKAGGIEHEGGPADLVFVRDITPRHRAESD